MIRADVEAVIRKAEAQIGTVEKPSYSNRTPYTAWYGLVGPWCAMFVSWCFWHAGHRLPAIRTAKGFAYCPDIVNWAKKNGTTLHGSTTVQSNWATYPTRAHAFHQLNDSATSTVGVTLGKSIPWASVDVYAVVGNPTAGGGDVRWTLYYGKNAGQTNARSSVSTTTTLAVGQATYPEPQRVKVGNAIAWDATGEWSLVLSRLGSDGADTLTTPIFLQGIAIRPAGT